MRARSRWRSGQIRWNSRARPDRLGARPDAELAVDALRVGLHRVEGDEEQRRRSPAARAAPPSSRSTSSSRSLNSSTRGAERARLRGRDRSSTLRFPDQRRDDGTGVRAGQQDRRASADVGRAVSQVPGRPGGQAASRPWHGSSPPVRSARATSRRGRAPARLVGASRRVSSVPRAVCAAVLTQYSSSPDCDSERRRRVLLAARSRSPCIRWTRPSIPRQATAVAPRGLVRRRSESRRRRGAPRRATPLEGVLEPFDAFGAGPEPVRRRAEPCVGEGSQEDGSPTASIAVSAERGTRRGRRSTSCSRCEGSRRPPTPDGNPS